MLPEDGAVAFLQEAKAERRLSVEDLRDAFAVPYETAAHRFTNLATRHLGIPVHFMKVHEGGTLHKAYENDGVKFPADPLGAIEGQPVCRQWTARVVFTLPDRFTPYYQYTDTSSGTYWCTSPRAAVVAGRVLRVRRGAVRARPLVPRARDHRARGVEVPGPDVLPAAARPSWPSAGPTSPGRAPARTRPCWPRCRSGCSPGVDTTEVYRFLDRHAPTS